MKPLIVLDTNVLVAALRSRQGSAFKMLERLGRESFDTVVSVPLVLEYEDVLSRNGMVSLRSQEVEAILDYLCLVSRHQNVFYLWRPMLADPKDDMVLELALNASAQYIVTYNIRDFTKAIPLGIAPLTPKQFLEVLK